MSCFWHRKAKGSWTPKLVNQNQNQQFQSAKLHYIRQETNNNTQQSRSTSYTEKNLGTQNINNRLPNGTIQVEEEHLEHSVKTTDIPANNRQNGMKFETSPNTPSTVNVKHEHNEEYERINGEKSNTNDKVEKKSGSSGGTLSVPPISTEKNVSVKSVKKKAPAPIPQKNNQTEPHSEIIESDIQHPEGNTKSSGVEEIKYISERNSIDNIEIRRRSGIIPRPVTIDESSIKKLPKHTKSSRDEELIRKALLANEFLSRLLKEGKRLQDVIDSMYSQEVTPNEVLIKQGETGSHMYVSAEGHFEVIINGQGVVSTFEDARVFGELALLHNAKRLATISATSHGKVWVLDQDVYNQLMVQTNIEERDEMVSFLQKVEKLNRVKPEVLRHVAKLLKKEYFPGGTEIVRQGDRGDKFYIIRAGSVTITKENEGVVNNFNRGKYFGELALLREDTRQATVTADPPLVECLTLTRKQFTKHFGEVDDIASITIDSHPKYSMKTAISEHNDINLMDLEIKGTLGVGGFGRVELVRHKTRKDLTFALKYLKKFDMVQQQQEEHVKNERNIQMSCRTIFIVRLYRTYRDNKYVYFLMESCLGGDLWNLLMKQPRRRFDEKNARFIAACVIEAIAYLHERNIIYRDLKPENLMIDVEGYIKLTDFGFAKKLPPDEKTYTFAGTPEYVAPEIVLNRGHDKSVDYWALGCFIYELLTGKTPFRTGDPNHMKTYNRILNGIDTVAFPSYIPNKAKHIVEKLCRPAVVERLGYQKGGVKDIKNHKWFLGFDWERLNERMVPSPFKPTLHSNIDLRYFDKDFPQDLDIPPDELSGWDFDF